MLKILKSFFCNSKGQFVPPYFWVTILMILVLTMVIMRICQKGEFSDTLILGVLGLVVGWCAVYNTGKFTKGKSVTDKLKEFVDKESSKDKKEKKSKTKGKK